MKPKTLMFYPNGNTAVFNFDGFQIPEAQEPWLLQFCEFLRERGFEIDETTEILLPDGSAAQLFKTSEDKWNWQITHKKF
jgi:hypothetical protein